MKWFIIDEKVYIWNVEIKLFVDKYIICDLNVLFDFLVLV